MIYCQAVLGTDLSYASEQGFLKVLNYFYCHVQLEDFIWCVIRIAM